MEREKTNPLLKNETSTYDQNLEILLESMIKMQAKLIENINSLNKRMNQVEYVLQKSSRPDIYYVQDQFQKEFVMNK